MGYNENDVLIEETYNLIGRNDLDIGISDNIRIESTESELKNENDSLAGAINVSKEECYKAFQKIKDYFNQEENFDVNAITGINEISKALSRKKLKTLDGLVKRIK